MSKKVIELSPLAHTWIFDIDGTLVKHNGYKIEGHDTLLPGVKEFFSNTIQESDFVILLTSRDECYKATTEQFLKENGIRFHQVIYNLPYGERILMNDKKPSGLDMSYSINTNRDEFCKLIFKINKDL